MNKSGNGRLKGRDGQAHRLDNHALNSVTLSFPTRICSLHLTDSFTTSLRLK